MVRSMMSHADLPHSFWGHALLTAAYKLNRVPSKEVEKTPYEIWSGKKPHMSYMKIWGCEVSYPKICPLIFQDIFQGTPTHFYDTDLKGTKAQLTSGPIQKMAQTGLLARRANPSPRELRKGKDEKGRKEDPSKQTLALTDGKPWRLTLRIPSNPKGNPEGKAGGSKVTSAQFDPIGQFKVTIRLQTGVKLAAIIPLLKPESAAAR
ncbi:hypothetical protein KIW84_023797 [Lathyrus oleraceus]|uniref:Uncharacterized protein n=1 Tax=Pisum sativum TaxID=3888 RepID=A0A9D4YHQ7_PEA|nr:hypothetical protein KIW84_023797 [Pisum sativum]